MSAARPVVHAPPVPWRVGLIAPKNTEAEQRWLLGLLRNAGGEIYRRGEPYDAVWFLNATAELRWIRAHTGARTFVVGMEPPNIYPPNYEAGLIRQADVYMGYRDYPERPAGQRFLPFAFPVHTERVIRREFAQSLEAVRDLDFCLFATHDPNIRRAVGELLVRQRSVVAGPLFGQRVARKLPVQRRCRYEFITENEIGDFYASEKIGEALMAGCVPVYWGCTRIREQVPPELFVDLQDFLVNGAPDIEAAIRHCLAPGVYERYQAALRERGLATLLGRFTIERNLVDPLERCIEEWRAAGIQPRRADLACRAWRLTSGLRAARPAPSVQCGRRSLVRQRLGTLVYDWPRFVYGMRLGRGEATWVQIRNRNDRLIADPGRDGVRCDWEGTRTLHLGDVFPFTGRLLLRGALRDWPVRLSERPADVAEAARSPDVTFLIGHRGLDRLPLLQQTLRSIAAQEGVRMECIVIEQDVEPLVRDRLPEWVDYVFDPVGEGQPFNRSRAFNRGAALARGPLLILHDGDTVVPAAYAAEHQRAADGGFEVVNLKRFVFYLGRSRGLRGYADEDLREGGTGVEAVVENATGGSSVGVRRTAFEAVGGMDEGFWGWGGEDVEWWDRCRTLRVLNSGFLPLLHLWHAPQIGKTPQKDGPAMQRLARILRIPAADRVRALRAGVTLEAG